MNADARSMVIVVVATSGLGKEIFADQVMVENISQN
jgi:hypothetical protein